MTISCALPGDRTLSLDGSVRGRLVCGVIVLSDVRVDDGPGAAEHTRRVAGELRSRYTGMTPGSIAPLKPARALYKAFGMDPSRHRPSSEALLRRVLKGLDLYRINSAVDSCNLASLEFLLPVGMYDLDRVRGDVTVRVGADGDEYPGIRKGPVHVGGRIALYDTAGPFGSPTSDSARTCVEEGATSILAVIFAPARYDHQAMGEHLELFGARFGAYCGAGVAMSHRLGWEEA